MYEEMANGVKIRSASGTSLEKNLQKFFFNLEKQNAFLISRPDSSLWWKKVTDKHKMNQELECFYKNLFNWKIRISKRRSSQINIPILMEEQSQTCKGPITESELLNALKSMPNNKSPENDGLTKEF